MLREESSGSVKILSIDYEQLIDTLRNVAESISKDNNNLSKLILFGSFCRKDYTPESDVDILIILQNSQKHFLQRKDDFISYFSAVPLDVNILVYTEAEVETMLNEENHFITEVLNEGMSLL